MNNFNKYSLISFSTLLILFWPLMSTGSLLKNWNGISTFFIIGICLALNKIKQNSPNSKPNSNLIPKIVHQIWIGPNSINKYFHKKLYFLRIQA